MRPVSVFLGGLVATLVGAGSVFGQNTPPAQPIITEPAFDGKIVYAGDVHMETALFSDPDEGQTHRCTDWEIWTIDPPERVWVTECIGGVERLHTHLGDGVYENSHEGRNALMYETDYMLRVRHRDSSNAPNSYSPWAERLFRTAAPTQIHGMELVDVVNVPPPTWTFGSEPIIFGAATPAAFLRIETGTGQPLFEMRSLSDSANQLLDFPTLTSHRPLRVRISAGGLAGGLVTPETEFRFFADDSRERTIYLPQLVLAAGQSATFWVAANGATYVGDASQTEPDFSQPARNPPVPWDAAPGYRVEVVAGGFRLPVNIAFHPDPGPEPDAPVMYVTELYGTIKVIYRDGSVHDFATNLVNYPPSGFFPGSGEQGLTGIAVQPGTNAVYASMLYEAPSGFHYPKVVRFSSSDGGRTSDGQTTILDMFGETQGQSHQVSNLTFGPDGMLYIHMGDGFDFTTALNLQSFRGKILRCRPDGTAPPDNPFYDAEDGITASDYVYAYGFRNPFGGAWRLRDGRHFSVENGPSLDRFAMIEPGVSYGWNGTDESMRINAITNWIKAPAPVNVAFIEPEVFGGSGFPADQMGLAYVTLSGPTWIEGPWLTAKRIAVYDISDNAETVEQRPPLVVYNGHGRGTACGLAPGPDGLYFTDLYEESGMEGPTAPGARVLRVRYVGLSDFHADIRRGPGPLAVRFFDASSVPEAEAWDWDFGDGTRSSERNPVHVYTQPGTYNVRLAVTGKVGPVVTQRNAYIEVTPELRVAYVGGAPEPLTWDGAAINALTQSGFDVEYFEDDDPGRPIGAELGQGRNLIIVSSTMSAPLVLQEFRDVQTPVLFWEQSMLQRQYEGLGNGTRQIGQAAIDIVNEGHPITYGLQGRTVVYSAPRPMNLVTPVFAPHLNVLATREGTPNEAAIALVETGGALLGDRRAAARRIFVFLDDATFPDLTQEGRALIERSVCWATGLATEFLSDPADVAVRAGEDVTLSALARGRGMVAYQWRRNGVEIPGATGPTLTLERVAFAHAGLYDVVATGECGSAVSGSATVDVVCAADYNQDGQVTSQDFFDFVSCFLTECPEADFNADSLVNTSDFFDFLTAFFGSCDG